MPARKKPIEADVLTAEQQPLVVKNKGLAYKIAGKYLWSGLSIDELGSAAMEGLIYGVLRYDPTRGAKLTTCLGYWIRAHVGRFVFEQSGPVVIGRTNPARRAMRVLRAERLRE